MTVLRIPSLRIGDLEAKIPVVQGGMGVGVSLSGLASAVGNAGGIGVIATPGIGQFEPDCHSNPIEANRRALRKEILQARSQTNGLIGVNVMVALSDFGGLIQCSVDAGANVVLLGAGLPTSLPDSLPLGDLTQVATKFIPIVSSARAADLVFKTWKKRYNHVPDAVVVEGPMAGGHLGFKREQIFDPEFALEKILPPVIEVVKIYEDYFSKHIPVIAAGGIYTGKDIYDIMQLGASGVQMGTQFVTTCECDASPAFKQAYLDCHEEDIIIINSPVGLPGRAIRGKFFERVMSGVKEKFKCDWKCLRSCDFKKVPYCIAQALTNAKKGLLDEGFAFAGANAYRAEKIISVQELIDKLVEEYMAAAQLAL
ncbi:MAG: nitronate monooxygenase family protein [Phycisphaerae bacterium]|nr:nitronate monooxygenase family protein [Phycisphaerae bacterium]